MGSEREGKLGVRKFRKNKDLVPLQSTTALISFLVPPHKTRRVKGGKSEEKKKSVAC